MPVQGSSSHHFDGAPVRPVSGAGPASLSDVPTKPVKSASVRPVKPTPPEKPVRSRTSAAWVGLCVGALVLVALVVFMMQNTAPVEVTFLGATGTAPLALELLIAGLGVGVVALVLGALRIGQLRRRIHADQQLSLPVR
jgi:lipopolysaccharide assembly protein A